METYSTPAATVQQVLKAHPMQVEQAASAQVKKVLGRISLCRTPDLGFHLYRCTSEQCGHVKYQYHSCRDRHCPKCGALKKEEWIEARTRELLPVKYYHVVFTLPHELNSLVMGHQRLLYKLLFDASSQTLLAFGRDEKYLGAQPGIISVLHTWGQQLSYHPHIHCIVSGGGITGEGKWKEATKNDWRFLFPVKAMSVVYRGKFMQGLKTLMAAGQLIPPEGMDVKALINGLYSKDWVVYAKAPFGGPQAVIEYLGRYTHKVAISNHRIIGISDEEDTVSFQYKDYADTGKQKEMTLAASEFIRRFSQHILPKGFTKIRMYGYLSNRGRHKRISEVLTLLELPQHAGAVSVPFTVRLLERYGMEVNRCPCCGENTLELVLVYLPWKRADDG
ncbi:IS91 family transposase [Chitinophagaceae bacterium LB-8]|uniref:IS91 family transposase n=1 Tax=Paraflavisolibacter caeni TaxID=2982496 RepID=A0A9X3BJI4_9BACT|nr:IS91 family transposase [Paraflavisolibacter caeni]MCU7552907.1 IS91 family transposase [Paraflavisolibacter caeni]